MIYEDVFKAWLPDDEYREYLEYRYGYVGDSIDELYYNYIKHYLQRILYSPEL